MSGLFGTSSGAQKPDYTGLQVQTSASILPVPIGWGLYKIAPNIIWYGNFQKQGGDGGKGGLFGSSGQTTYSAAVMMALCEGPIAAILRAWKDQSVYGDDGTSALTSLGLVLFTGTSPQLPWSYLTTSFPAQALSYPGTAYVASPDYDLGSSATIGSHNFEASGPLHSTGFNGIDADPAQVVYDFLTNEQYGAGFPAANVDIASLLAAGTSVQAWCMAVGMAISPALTSQETASDILGRWCQLINVAPFWSEGLLKFVPYGDAAIAAGTVVPVTEARQIPTPQTPADGSPPPLTLTVGFARQFVADGAVTNAATGVAFVKVAGVPAAGQYSVASGVYTFATADAGADIVIAYTYAVAASFTPDLAPIYDLGVDDFLVGDAGTQPITVARSDPHEVYNLWRVEIQDRDNGYASTPIESRDQGAIETFGRRIASTVTGHEICSPIIGALSGQMMLQRALHIRNTYTFSLPWEFCVLDPMDIVTVTDLDAGLDHVAVRIVSLEEGGSGDDDGDGPLAVTAEEFPGGVAVATLYTAAGAAGTRLRRNVVPAAVNPPLIIEPPPALLNGAAPQVWAAVSAAGADPNWGGANVYVSLDGVSYQLQGQVLGPARQGSLTAPLPAYVGANPDTTNTLAVDIGESGGELETASVTAAQQAVTLCWVGGEYLAYATSTLTGTASYALTGLQRGLYGSSPGSHASGATFARLDGMVFKLTLPGGYVGKTLHLKFQSINIFGGSAQDLSTCVDYVYTPTGAGYGPAPDSPTNVAATGSAGSAALSARMPNSVNAAALQFYRGATGGGFGVAVPVGSLLYGGPNAALAMTDTVTAGSYDYWAVALNTGGVPSSPAGPATATVT